MIDNTEQLLAALRPLAAIPFEDFGAIRNKPESILMAWNGVELTVKHVIDAREAIRGAQS